MTLASPYLKPGFYADALARGKHRDIVGGRWEETALHQMQVILDEGLERHDHFLDIGCGCLRLGHRLVPWLDHGHYWGTDASHALMLHGHAHELTPEARARLPADQLREDSEFRFPGLPASITFALCWGVFTHLPAPALRPALVNMRQSFPALRKFLLTVFLAPEAHDGPFRQRDGVVTHPNRPPWHRAPSAVEADAQAAGYNLRWRDDLLPRGQALAVLTRQDPPGSAAILAPGQSLPNAS
ncbi:class I SAM-dependent methyltransferase [Pseudogemmobacter hezensis]|uniref:class I SAM-dependent methyltransferase n=1 Tax=Pseudogemmobacter hezensis TaxID=2737662 RepID=UPI001C12E8CC|nr:class I SAM-dependent methyltransferase [Pseudogemmobacter hezensis]